MADSQLLLINSSLMIKWPGATSREFSHHYQDNNPELEALLISKFVKKVEESEEKVTVLYYVGEDHL
jgi:hypothetical protein